MQSVCMQFVYMQSVCMQSECMQFVCMQSVRMQSVCMQFVYIQSVCVQSAYMQSVYMHSVCMQCSSGLRMNVMCTNKPRSRDFDSVHTELQLILSCVFNGFR